MDSETIQTDADMDVGGVEAACHPIGEAVAEDQETDNYIMLGLVQITRL
jgi:uncharacterized metal-binding protein